MHRTTLSTCRRIGLAAVFLLAGACGQNEGGRCQIASDCASGLICQNGITGNGICERPGSQTTPPVVNDAAADGAEADVLVSAPEATPDLGASDSVRASSIDAESSDTGAID